MTIVILIFIKSYYMMYLNLYLEVLSMYFKIIPKEKMYIQQDGMDENFSYAVFLKYQGSFPRSGFSFKVFYPSSKTVEDR